MKNKTKNKQGKPAQLKQIIAGRDRDPFITVFQGLLKPNDDTLASRGAGKGLAIYDELERDCHTFAVLQKRKYAIVSYPWEIDPATDAGPDVRAADGIREICESLDIDGLTVGLLDAILKGYAVSEIEWNPETWAPLRFHMRDQRRFIFDVEASPRLLTPENKTTGEELPERKFIIHRFGSKAGNPYGLGLGSRLFWPVLFKRQGIAFWLAFAEKFGGPTVLGKYPEFMDENKQAELLDTLEKVNQETAIVAPIGTEIELLEAARSGSIDTYERLLRYMDEEISKAVLGETLTTNMGDTGSYAASMTHNGVRMELVRADADLLSQTLNDSLMLWLTEFHFPGANPPRLWRRIEESVDEKAEAEKDQVIYNMGFEADEEYIQEKYGTGWKKRATAGMDGFAGAWGGADDSPRQSTSSSTDIETIDPTQQAAPAGVGAVQDTALNGAQVASLLQIIEAVAAGTIPKDSATHIIRATFPSVSEDSVQGMVGPIKISGVAPIPPHQAKEQPGVEYAEADVLIDQAEASGVAVWDRLLEPVRRLVANASSFEEIREGILDIYPEMDTEGITETLSDALTAAFVRGKASVRK